MSVSTGTSLILSSVFVVLLFSGMQIYKPWFASSSFNTIFGGYLGSLLFVLSLTAVGNLKNQMFGKQSQVKLYPEVLVCFIFSLIAAGSVHRVCATTCILFSITALYYLNKYSQKVYAVQSAPVVPVSAKKRK